MIFLYLIKKMKKTLLSLAIIVVLFSFGLYYTKKKQSELRKYGEPARAIVVRKYKVSKSRSVEYKFMVNGYWYLSRNLNYGKFEIGDTINIIYSKLNPETTKIIYKDE